MIHIVKVKWLIYTVLVGLIPIVLRALMWIILPHQTIALFSVSDFVAFGLILHNFKEVIMNIIGALSVVESGFTGKLENEIIIDPIAIYREI